MDRTDNAIYILFDDSSMKTRVFNGHAMPRHTNNAYSVALWKNASGKYCGAVVIYEYGTYLWALNEFAAALCRDTYGPDLCRDIVICVEQLKFQTPQMHEEFSKRIEHKYNVRMIYPEKPRPPPPVQHVNQPVIVRYGTVQDTLLRFIARMPEFAICELPREEMLKVYYATYHPQQSECDRTTVQGVCNGIAFQTSLEAGTPQAQQLYDVTQHCFPDHIRNAFRILTRNQWP